MSTEKVVAATKAPKEEKKEEVRAAKKPERTGEERSLEEQVAAIEKALDAKTARLKELARQLRDKEAKRVALRRKVLESREAIKRVRDQQKAKRETQKRLFDEVQQFMKGLHERRNRHATMRVRLLKLLPPGASLPRRRDEYESSAVSDFDLAVQLVRDEIRELEMLLSTKPMSLTEERRTKGEISTWNRQIAQILELQAEFEGPQPELGETDVLVNLNMCRSLEKEIVALNESCAPHFAAIAAAVAEMAANREGLPQLLAERAALLGEVKGLVERLHKVRFDLDYAHYKASNARFEKRRADALKESAEYKARFERQKEARAAMLEKAKNNLPHEHELETAKRLLAYLRSVALPGTCDVTEESYAAAAAARAAKAEMESKRLVSAPSVEIAEDARSEGTQRVVSRKEQAAAPVGKRAKRAQAKAAAAAAAASKKAAAKEEAAAPKPKKEEEKPKQPGDKMKHGKTIVNDFEALSLTAPATYADADKSYHELQEKIAEYEKVRALVREEREKALLDEPKKEEEEKKEEETPAAAETPAAESQ